MTTVSGNTAFATRDDIKAVLGNLDQAQILAILQLKPTITDVEKASLLLGGDPDVFGAGMAVKGNAAEIIAILSEDEEDEEPRAG